MSAISDLKPSHRRVRRLTLRAPALWGRFPGTEDPRTDLDADVQTRRSAEAGSASVATVVGTCGISPAPARREKNSGRCDYPARLPLTTGRLAGGSPLEPPDRWLLVILVVRLLVAMVFIWTTR